MTPPTTFPLPPKLRFFSMYHNDSDRFPNRKRPRLASFNYSTPNYYFITICTHNKKCIFGKPNQLNAFGNIALQALTDIQRHFPNVTVDKAVVMPNHVHAIIVLDGHGTNLSVVVGLYKSYVSKQIHNISPNLKVWQTSFHDHVIRGQQSYEKIWNYIDGNPSKWEDDCFYIYESDYSP